MQWHAVVLVDPAVIDEVIALGTGGRWTQPDLAIRCLPVYNVGSELVSELHSQYSILKLCKIIIKIQITKCY